MLLIELPTSILELISLFCGFTEHKTVLLLSCKPMSELNPVFTVASFYTPRLNASAIQLWASRLTKLTLRDFEEPSWWVNVSLPYLRDLEIDFPLRKQSFRLELSGLPCLESLHVKCLHHPWIEVHSPMDHGFPMIRTLKLFSQRSPTTRWIWHRQFRFVEHIASNQMAVLQAFIENGRTQLRSIHGRLFLSDIARVFQCNIPDIDVYVLLGVRIIRTSKIKLTVSNHGSSWVVEIHAESLHGHEETSFRRMKRFPACLTDDECHDVSLVASQPWKELTDENRLRTLKWRYKPASYIPITLNSHQIVDASAARAILAACLLEFPKCFGVLMNLLQSAPKAGSFTLTLCTLPGVLFQG